MTIQSGTAVFDVYAMDKPLALGGKEVKIATMVTDSNTTTSYYGDEMLLFRH